MSSFDFQLIFDFLRQLAANNNRPWFEQHRPFYEQARDEFARFSQVFTDLVCSIDPSIGLVDPKACIYRIYRDVRFSPDKSPYKQHMCIFVAPGGKNSRLPGYYFHVQPGHMNLFGAGQYCLSADDLRRLRSEISAFPEELHGIISNPAFSSRLNLNDNERLKKLPRGFDIDPQYAELLKFKTLCSQTSFSDDDVVNPDFLNTLETCVRAAFPLNAFFRRALDSEPC